ncbi:MAG TPA: hypothetical protein VKC66_03360 [Xanthobacteraceae bacterium]|nr:hypothetical protein [Xanthobacteraceae bacterium]
MTIDEFRRRLIGLLQQASALRWATSCMSSMSRASRCAAKSSARASTAAIQQQRETV